MILKELWKDINKPTDQIRTAWFRHGVVISASPVAIVAIIIMSIAMILCGDFNALDTIYREFKIVFNDCWKGLTT